MYIETQHRHCEPYMGFCSCFMPKTKITNFSPELNFARTAGLSLGRSAFGCSRHVGGLQSPKSESSTVSRVFCIPLKQIQSLTDFLQVQFFLLHVKAYLSARKSGQRKQVAYYAHFVEMNSNPFCGFVALFVIFMLTNMMMNRFLGKLYELRVIKYGIFI